MKGLNFKDWEKIASDKQSTTLRHKKGHVMAIAHAALPKIQQEQLKRLKMADGGPVDDLPEPNKQNAAAMQKGATQGDTDVHQMWSNVKSGLGMAKGGSVKGIHVPSEEDESGYSPAGTYSRGEAETGGTSKKFWKQAAKGEHQRVLGEMRDMKGKNREYLADGTPPESVQDSSSSDDSTSDSSSNPDHSTTININAAPAAASSPAQAATTPPTPPSPPQYTGQGPYQGSEQVKTPPVGGPDRPGITGALQNEQQAITQKQNIAAEQGAAQAVFQDANLKKQQAITNQSEQDIQGLRKQADVLAASPQFNQNRYWEQKSVPQKIQNTLALMLGGFQGGFNGTGNNPAYNILMAQQDKDIQNQKDNFERQKNVFGAYHQLYGDEQIATNLAKVNNNDLLIGQTNLMKNKLATPQADAEANAISANLQKDNYLKLGQTAQRIRGIQAGQIKPQPVAGSAPLSQGAKAGSPQNIASKEGSSFSTYQPSPILQPGAEDKFNRLAVTPLMTPEQKNDITNQYNSAYAADYALKHLPSVMQAMKDNATGTGALARTLTPDMAGAIGEMAGPIIGGIAGAGSQGIAYAGDTLFGTNQFQQNKEYNGAKAKFTDLLTNALRGNPNVTPHQIQGWADTYAPEVGDDDARLLSKLKNMEAIIKQNAKVGTLTAKGWAKIQ